MNALSKGISMLLKDLLKFMTTEIANLLSRRILKLIRIAPELFWRDPVCFLEETDKVA